MDFDVCLVLDAACPDDEARVVELVGGLIDGLEMYGGNVTAMPSGRIGLMFRVPASTLREATTTALAVGTAPGHPEPFALEIRPTHEPGTTRVQEEAHL